jgi:hypothetical protein
VKDVFQDVGLQSAKEITDALPGVEKTITDAVSGLQVLVTQTVVPILAEIVSQALAQINRLDGATVTMVPNGKLEATVNVSVQIPTFTATLNMPLKPEH